MDSRTTDKRYIVQIDAYIYAENDKQAKDKAQELARWASVDDNHAAVVDLVEQPFGQKEGRQVNI